MPPSAEQVDHSSPFTVIEPDSCANGGSSSAVTIHGPMP